MIELEVNQPSVDQTVEWLESVRLKIFAGVRDAMEEGMLDLAGVVLVEMSAAGIKNRTGDLAESIIKSPKVTETATAISGRVKAEGQMKLGGRTFLGFLGTALDEGYHVPDVDGNLYQFSEPDGDTLYRRGHVAFDVKPHPFLREASEAYSPTLIELIEARVNEVVAEANR